MPSKKKKNEKKATGSSSIQNRKARHDYFVEETIVCGIVLSGTEVKSIRLGQVQLKDSFAKIENGEVWLYNCHISEYKHGNRFNHIPTRKRKLLLNKREILKVYQKTQEKNLALVPLKIFFKRNFAKLELALAKGKKMYDKRDSIKKKELGRTLDKIKKKYT